ncbi:hypothetical protein [Pseudophaeobacter sp.]|uniref:hypothetical protein n=1 Tax=Pseudophaeobacter sp. TaxID=1971739 RepID=UPI00329A1382
MVRALQRDPIGPVSHRLRLNSLDEIKSAYRVQLRLAQRSPKRYPAPEWSIDLLLRGPGQIDLTSTENGDNHAFHAAAAATKDWAPDHYRYELRVSDGVDVVTVETGETRIAPDLAAIGLGQDGRDHVRKVLDAVEAEGRRW